MKEIEHLASGGTAWISKGSLLSLRLLATLGLVVMLGVLTVVVLTATALPATAVRHKGTHRGKRDGTNASKFSAARKVVAAS